jgi:guanylate kinase
MEELARRLYTRNTDSEEAIQKRLDTAVRELEYAERGGHDRVIVNEDLELAYRELEEFCLAE